MTGLNYAARGKGPGRQNFLEAGAFLKSRPDLDRPGPATALRAGDHAGPRQDGGAEATRLHHPCLPAPARKPRFGRALTSADPLADPAIRANYLATEEDRRALREGAKMVREVANQSALKEICGAELFPGPGVQSDADIDAWIRRTAETIYHPVGTCRMGVAGDAMAVVDETLKVFGLEGLRVAGRVGHADPGGQQHQCADHHGRGEGGST